SHAQGASPDATGGSSPCGLHGPARLDRPAQSRPGNGGCSRGPAAKWREAELSDPQGGSAAMKRPGVAGPFHKNRARSVAIAAQRILDPTDRVLDLAFGLVHLAFGFELGVTDGLADAFLHAALHLLHTAFD